MVVPVISDEPPGERRNHADCDVITSPWFGRSE
jgi:hypothetical protein